METWIKIIELLVKILAVLSWPIVIISIIFIFKDPLKSFMSNIKKIEYGNLGIETIELNKQNDDEEKSPIEILSKGETNKDIDKSISLFSDETIESIEILVRNDTKLDSYPSSEEKQNILFKYSQLLYIIVQFNKMYESIFGSQLAILQRLNSSTNETKETLIRFYDIAKLTYPKIYENYSFDNFLLFLSSNSLITFDNNTIKITAYGKDFLKYLIEVGLSIQKNY